MIVALKFQGHSFPGHPGFNCQTASLLLLGREQQADRGANVCLLKGNGLL